MEELKIIEDLCYMLWGPDWRTSKTVEMLGPQIREIFSSENNLKLENKMLKDRGDEMKELLLKFFLIGTEDRTQVQGSSPKPILPKGFGGMNEIPMKDIPVEVQDFFKKIANGNSIDGIKIIDKNPPKKILDLKIENLKLSDRVSFALARNGIKTVEDLIGVSREKLLKLRSLGPKGVAEIEAKMLELGLKPKDKYKG